MQIKIIRNETQYKEALLCLEESMESQLLENSLEQDMLETLALLIEQYEKTNFSLDTPDPIQAILFRMEQAKLTPRDLVAFLGSRSKVSEVLSGKRPLSLNMIRSLHHGLGIPAEVLIGVEEPEQIAAETNFDQAVEGVKWEEFPLREMLLRGYFDGNPKIADLKKRNVDLTQHAQELMSVFMQPLGIRVPLAAPMLMKRTLTTRAARAMNTYALSSWSMRVLLLAGQNTPSVQYEPEVLTFEFLNEVARLSWSDRGPLLAQEFLFKHGISLIIEPHLPRTHLDGAAIAFWEQHPVIGLTLRHDRVDNFWFCLLHELVHLKLHFWDEQGHFLAGYFYDDMDAEAIDPREKEADDVAGESLIPKEIWRKSPVSVLPSPQAVQRLAKELRIHPAIVAGRVRHTKNSFRLLNNLVGQGEIRKHFPQISWKGEEE